MRNRAYRDALSGCHVPRPRALCRLRPLPLNQATTPMRHRGPPMHKGKLYRPSRVESSKGELNERLGVLFATDCLRSRSPPGTDWRVRSPSAHFARPNYLRKQQDQMKSMRGTEESCFKFGLSTTPESPKSRLRPHWRLFFQVRQLCPDVSGGVQPG